MHSQPKNKTNRNEKNNEENVTEASVAASLNAKVNTYKRSVPAMVRSNAEKRHNSLKDSEVRKVHYIFHLNIAFV